jgi:N-acetylglucosamine-6-phosphate deacetylase
MTNALLIHNSQIMTPEGLLKPGWLLSEGKTIRRIGPGKAPGFPDALAIDGRGLTLLPGFIDIHVHGAVGAEAMDASPDSLRKMAAFYARHGVTGFLPTTWTESRERIMATLEVIAELQGPQPDGATILGAHLEGPYFNPEKRGAQREEYVRRATQEEALTFLDLGVIRLLALAPEYEENHWLIDECVRRGITVSAAHTTASYEQMKAAAAMGLTHATHTYNAMVGLNHREPGTVGAVMTIPEIRCELIADNVHIHPAAMQILFAAKGADRVILITDAVCYAGLPDGEYDQDGRNMIVHNGIVRLSDGTLAGSTSTLNVGVRNLMQATGQSLDAIWQTSSLNAARAIHMADHKGSLEVGKDADFVLADEQINVHLTVAEGRIVYQDD